MVAHTLRLNRAALHGEGMDLARRTVARVVRRTFNRSQVLVPVDTGRLRASGRTNVGERGSVVVGEVVYDTQYAAARRVRETDRIARELAALRVGHRIKKRRRTS